jgi:Na+-driven multidrug efflux pump
MAGTGAIGLVAIFSVDLINLLYISMLGEQAIAAAVGFAGVVGFFHLSIYIGIMIGIVATLARRIGARQMDEARALASSSMFWVTVLSVLLTGLNLLFLDPILRLLGADGGVLELAHSFLVITLPSTVLLGLGMACTALLRSVGDARRSMMVTLVPAVVIAVLDPIFIFGFNLGLTGAAVVVLIARCVLLGQRVRPLRNHHRGGNHCALPPTAGHNQLPRMFESDDTAIIPAPTIIPTPQR